MSQKFFYNKIVTRNQAIALSKKSADPNSFKEYVWNVILGGADYDPYRKEIYSDYIISVYKFCLANHFSAEKVSTLLSIAIYIFNESIEKKLRFNESFDFLKSLLNLHEIQREPYFMGIFSPIEKNDILKFFKASFYKHYTLYDVAMTKSINYKVSLVDKLETKLPRLTILSDGIEINPERIPQLAAFLPQNQEPEANNEAGEQNELNQAQEGELEKVNELHKEEEKEATKEDYIKTEEDLKLEEALNQKLKTFYNQMESKFKERSEEMINKIDAKGKPKKK